MIGDFSTFWGGEKCQSQGEGGWCEEDNSLGKVGHCWSPSQSLEKWTSWIWISVCGSDKEDWSIKWAPTPRFRGLGCFKQGDGRASTPNLSLKRDMIESLKTKMKMAGEIAVQNYIDNFDNTLKYDNFANFWALSSAQGIITRGWVRGRIDLEEAEEPLQDGPCSEMNQKKEEGIRPGAIVVANP